METSAPITIYNASAGSGKTFTLVALFLQKLLTAPNADYYKSFLAITFTNKAVAEMKQRIIKNLVSFSEEKSLTEPPVMLQHISETTKTPIKILHANSKKSLKHLLHHYAQFSVETIDHFNHRLIRTFARDLKLPAHFEVSLDMPQLISEAVDNLISKAGENNAITDVLIEFALQKTDDDKSWDISYDIINTAGLLLNENDACHVNRLKQRTLTDFQQLKKTLHQKRKNTLERIQKLAKNTLETLQEAGLEKTDFNGGSRAYFPSYLEKIAAQNLKVSFGTVWQTTMGDKPMYPKTKTTDLIAQTIDALTPDFIDVFEQSKILVGTIWMYENILKNLTPLSVLHLVQKELETLKEEQNVLPISEFNALINKEIKNQPAPFIYERLGDRYHHFFIDEFQDTSLLQWQNLIPLVDNAVSQEFDETSGSVLLVGDAKQAIYRWRGGLPEQFMDLYHDTNPFSNPLKHVKNLDTNWRSHEQVIRFNNSFFTFLSNHLESSIHQHLYEIGNQQNTNTKPEGYVHLEFINPENKNEADALYGNLVFETIVKLTTNKQYKANDICILTRTKKDGVAVSTYLLAKGVQVVSSETLLLQHSPLVQCLVNGLTVSLYPENNIAKVSLLDFLHTHASVSTPKHDFLKACLEATDGSFSEALEVFDIAFNTNTIAEKSLYQACEYMIHLFQLDAVADAYLFAFMDMALDFQNQPQAGKINFLAYWETKKERASIPANNTPDAVRVMTIHKSKGLEFPIVIYPYATTKLYSEQNAKAWFPIEGTLFKESLINFNNDVAHYGTIGEQLFQERRNTLALDTINLLYVTLTRAVKQLYIFSEIPSKIKLDQPDDFRQLFVAYLSHSGHWNANQLVYTFGNYKKTNEVSSEEKEEDNYTQIEASYLVSSPENHQLHVATSEASLWQTEAEIAIDIGNLLHDTMELVYTQSDVITVLESYRERGLYPNKDLETLEAIATKIVHHPEVSHLYVNELSRSSIFNERDIITSYQKLIRPDRINFFKNNEVTITDYKTGTPKKSHEQQIHAYAQTLKDLGFTIVNTFLIYSNGTEISINKN